MKKFMIAVAMTAVFGTAVINAQIPTNPQEPQTPVTAVADDFKEITPEELPQAVRDAVAQKFEGKTIKNAYVRESSEAKTYKVTLADAEGNASDILFNEKGEVQP